MSTAGSPFPLVIRCICGLELPCIIEAAGYPWCSRCGIHHRLPCPGTSAFEDVEDGTRAEPELIAAVEESLRTIELNDPILIEDIEVDESWLVRESGNEARRTHAAGKSRWRLWSHGLRGPASERVIASWALLAAATAMGAFGGVLINHDTHLLGGVLVGGGLIAAYWAGQTSTRARNNGLRGSSNLPTGRRRR